MRCRTENYGYYFTLRYVVTDREAEVSDFDSRFPQAALASITSHPLLPLLSSKEGSGKQAVREP